MKLLLWEFYSWELGYRLICVVHNWSSYLSIRKAERDIKFGRVQAKGVGLNDGW